MIDTAIRSRGIGGSEVAEFVFRYVDEFTWRLNEGNVIHHTREPLG